MWHAGSQLRLHDRYLIKDAGCPGSSWRVAATLLPDILPFDHTRPASYPENGRALTDDVQDHFLTILTNGKVTTDGVGPHGDLLADFPYLGPPHAAARFATPL